MEMTVGSVDVAAEATAIDVPVEEFVAVGYVDEIVEISRVEDERVRAIRYVETARPDAMIVAGFEEDTSVVRTFLIRFIFLKALALGFKSTDRIRNWDFYVYHFWFECDGRVVFRKFRKFRRTTTLPSHAVGETSILLQQGTGFASGKLVAFVMLQTTEDTVDGGDHLAAAGLKKEKTIELSQQASNQKS